MIDVEPMIVEELERLVPAPGTAGLDWADVARRAGAGRRRRRLLLSGVALLGLLLVSVGFTRALGGFGGWLSGEPGKPASTAQQRAFERSIRSWNGFPQGTNLRQLVQATVGGTTYRLQGFRGAGSLCLRLRVAGSLSADQLSCPPLTQLRASRAPALVVAADYGIGEAKQRSGLPVPIYGVTPEALVSTGIVADGVQKVEVAYSTGATVEATVGGDAFLAVLDHPTAGEHLTHVWALSGGRRVPIPFVLQATPFGWPSGTGQRLSAHGPSRVQRVIHGGTIGWLARRQPIGLPVPGGVHGRGTHVSFAREITPNPAAPERLVVSLVPNHDIRGGRRFGGRYQVCADIVGGRYGGGGCWPTEQVFSTAPFSESVSTARGGQYVTVAGLASDEVARLRLYLGNGHSESVPLDENGYLVEAPMVDYPLRLVAYDDHDLVIGVVTIHGSVSAAGAAPPRPIANARWRHIVSSSAGDVFAAPATGGGTCYEIVSPHGGGSVGCESKLSPRSVSYSTFASPKQEPTVAIHTGSAVARVAIRYTDGQQETIKPVDGFALTRIPATARSGAGRFGIASVTSLDANGHPLMTRTVHPLTAGSGTITSLTASAITIGHASCRITTASPPLAGYTVGARVEYLCRQGALTLVGRAKPGRTWNARTILIRGRILALTAGAITLSDSDHAKPGGPVPRRTCTITSQSPPTTDYHVGDQVQAFCAGGDLTGINRTASP